MQSPATDGMDGKIADGGDGGSNLKHAAASTAQNFEMGVSRAKVASFSSVQHVRLLLYSMGAGVFA